MRILNTFFYINYDIYIYLFVIFNIIYYVTTVYDFDINCGFEKGLETLSPQESSDDQFFQSKNPH